MVDRLHRAIELADRRLEVVGAGSAQTAIVSRRHSRGLWRVILGASALVTACMAAFGLYSLMSYTVTCWMPEYGLRLALGASTRQVVTLVLMSGLRLFLTGAPIGVGVGSSG
jgi:hypothetical protein